MNGAILFIDLVVNKGLLSWSVELGLFLSLLRFLNCVQWPGCGLKCPLFRLAWRLMSIDVLQNIEYQWCSIALVILVIASCFKLLPGKLGPLLLVLSHRSPRPQQPHMIHRMFTSQQMGVIRQVLLYFMFLCVCGEIMLHLFSNRQGIIFQC